MKVIKKRGIVEERFAEVLKKGKKVYIPGRCFHIHLLSSKKNEKQIFFIKFM